MKLNNPKFLKNNNTFLTNYGRNLLSDLKLKIDKKYENFDKD